MKLLMHICCAPCANMPIDALRAEGVELTGYWYNPNIHPFTEYRARRNCLQKYAKTIDLPLLVRDDYGLRPFVREVAEDIAGRCVKCYEMRLFEAARAAKEGGFDAFTSSLFISPYQKHELMRDVGYRAAEEYGVRVYYQDFRHMFRGSSASTCRNTAAASFPSRSAIRSPAGSSPESHARPSRTERGGRALFAEIRSQYEFAKISACNFACISQKFCRIQKKDCIIQKLYLHFMRISCTMRETVCRRVLIHDGTDDAS